MFYVSAAAAAAAVVVVVIIIIWKVNLKHESLIGVSPQVGAPGTTHSMFDNRKGAHVTKSSFVTQYVQACRAGQHMALEGSICGPQSPEQFQ